MEGWRGGRLVAWFFKSLSRKVSVFVAILCVEQKWNQKRGNNEFTCLGPPAHSLPVVVALGGSCTMGMQTKQREVREVGD